MAGNRAETRIGTAENNRKVERETLPDLLERIENAVHEYHRLAREERERQQLCREGYRWAVYDMRNALLVAAVAINTEWQNQLARDGERVRSTTDINYASRLQGLNKAFAALGQIESRITIRLDIDKFRKSAFEGSRYTCQAQLSVPCAPVSARVSARRYRDIDQTEYEAGYQYMRERLDHDLQCARSRIPVEFDSQQTLILEKGSVHEIAVRASHGVRDNWGDRGRGPERLDHPDFDCGQRKAIMDWSHQHNHRLSLVIQLLNQQVGSARNSVPQVRAESARDSRNDEGDFAS
jgi:hypothetical protein